MQDQPDPAGTPGEPPSEPRRRERVLNLPAVVVVLIALCVGVHLVRYQVLTVDQDLALLVRTAFIPVRYSGQFPLDAWAFVSPFAYNFLHADILHLANNMLWLAAAGSPLANRLGAPRFLAFSAVSGLAAAGLFFAVQPYYQGPLVGASGAIAGMMGAVARFGFRADRSASRPELAGSALPIRELFRSRGVVTFIALWGLTNLLLAIPGFVPGVDGFIAWEAHVGGFLAGLLTVGWFDAARRRP